MHMQQIDDILSAITANIEISAYDINLTIMNKYQIKNCLQFLLFIKAAALNSKYHNFI